MFYFVYLLEILINPPKMNFFPLKIISFFLILTSYTSNAQNNTAYIPDDELLNYLKADYPDAIVNDSLNIDQAHLITDINIDLNNNYYEISTLEGLESCNNINQVKIEGTSISDLSPLFGNTSLSSIQIKQSLILSETLNELISIQSSSFEQIEIYYNT